MITVLSDNCYTPLGLTTGENVNRVLRGDSALREYAGGYASLFQQEIKCIKGLNRFETLCIRSADEALSHCAVDPSSSDVRFVLSTTKGDIEHLATAGFRTLAQSAQLIAEYFGNPNTPVVVSNACTSGVCAMVTAMRILSGSESCRYVIVIGADVLSEFIVSGFQSFKALSDEPCRPFDAARKGLNLGEAAATMILSSAATGGWQLLGGAVRNDANHISGPSRTGEGSYRCLRDVLRDFDTEQLALVSCHGTATNYNDEMESVALHRMGLDAVPVNSLKSCYGHTLGAAGLLETIVNMHAVERGFVPGVGGYENCGTSYPLNISAACRPTDKRAMVKLISGFGGTNAAVLLSMQ